MFWTNEKPKSAITQVISVKYNISLKRRPFNGEFCECWQVLLKNGETWNFYHNQRHRVYQKIVL